MWYTSASWSRPTGNPNAEKRPRRAPAPPFRVWRGGASAFCGGAAGGRVLRRSVGDALRLAGGRGRRTVFCGACAPLYLAGRAGAVRGACGRGGWRARLANAFLRARRFVCLRKMQRATRGGRLAGGRGGRRAVSCGVARTVSCKARREGEGCHAGWTQMRAGRGASCGAHFAELVLRGAALCLAGRCGHVLRGEGGAGRGPSSFRSRRRGALARRVFARGSGRVVGRNDGKDGRERSWARREPRRRR